MNHYIKSFLHRGLLFGGFGPIIVGIIYAILETTVENFTVNGIQFCIAIISSYFLAFIQAGTSVFEQVEHWPVPKSLFFHFTSLYAIYVICYLVNTWIPFKKEVILIFTVVFVATFFIIWFIVYFSVRATSKKMNAAIR